MEMCTDCAALKKSYEDLLKQLIDAKAQVDAVGEQISGLQSTFENVVIDSEQVGSEQFANCSTSFSYITSELSTSILNCEEKIAAIVCTHLDDEEEQNI